MKRSRFSQEQIIGVLKEHQQVVWAFMPTVARRSHTGASPDIFERTASSASGR
jgi:hypothetical protein